MIVEGLSPRSPSFMNGARRGPHGVAGSAVRVVHGAVPGRVRLSVPGLKHTPERARRVEVLAADWPGVRGARASATTGSLLLEFDPATTTMPALVARAQSEIDRWAEVNEGSHSGRRDFRLGASDNNGTSLAGGSRPSRRITEAGSPEAISLAGSRDASESVPPPRPKERTVEAVAGAAALIAAGAALLAVRSHGHKLALDQLPLALAEEIHNPPLTAFMRAASGLVEPSVIWPVTFAATLLGVGRQRPGDVPWLAPAAVLGGGAVVTILKTLLRRGRPTAFEHLAPTRGYSLPSGHAFLAVCLYGLLAHHGFRWLRARRPEARRAAAVLLVVAASAVVLVGVSRIYLGVHYPTDVIAGYALALLWLFFLAAINDRPRPALAA
jgi:membrane-associated phospholipid phosphatase